MKFFHGTRAALLAAAASSVCVLGHASFAGEPLGEIKTLSYGKCIAIANATNVPGTPAVQATCDGSSARRMRLLPTGDGHYSIVVGYSSKCLGVAHGSRAADAQIVQGNCREPHAEWALTPAAQHEWTCGYTLKAKHSGMCMDVYHAMREEGANMVQFPCNGQNNQTFYFGPGALDPNDPGVTDPGRPVAIKVNSSGRCLTAEHSAQPEAAALAHICHYTRSQQWLIRANGNGTMQLVSAASGKCLDVRHSSASAGAQVLHFDCHGGTNQQWRQQASISGSVQWVSVSSGMCLAPDESAQTAWTVNPQVGTPVIQTDCNTGKANQQWTLQSQVPV
jgi:hypothetical protein